MVKKIIDVENLQIWDSLTKCARELCCSPQAIYAVVGSDRRVKGRCFEYYDEWLTWDNELREEYTVKKNIYWL